MRTLILGLIVLSLTACVSNPGVDSLSPAELETYRRIQILEGDVPESYTVVAEVKGKECHTTVEQSRGQTTADAITVLKVKAAKQGADAVVNIKCAPDRTTDWRNDCWSSMLCVGTAVRFQ